MAEQVPSVGRIVHFVYGDKHVPAIVIDPEFVIAHPEAVGGGEAVTQALVVFTIQHSFTTTAECDPNGAPATWHWPEFVPPKSDERRDYGTSDHPMTKAEADAAPRVSGETGASA